MYALQDSMWQEILKFFCFLDELNKALDNFLRYRASICFGTQELLLIRREPTKQQISLTMERAGMSSTNQQTERFLTWLTGRRRPAPSGLPLADFS